MVETAPGWFWVVTLGLMPAALLLLWTMSRLPPAGVVHWVAEGGFTYIFVAAGIGTGLMLWYGASHYV